MGQVERVAASVGVPLDAFLSLAAGALEDVALLGPAAALTGPVARGDLETIDRHRGALDPAELDGYDAGVALARVASWPRAGRCEQTARAAVTAATLAGFAAAGRSRPRPPGPARGGSRHPRRVPQGDLGQRAASALGARAWSRPWAHVHHGHLALLRVPRSSSCDVVAATIFVNPLQFASPEDWERYPADLEHDLATAEVAWC